MGGSGWRERYSFSLHADEAFAVIAGAGLDSSGAPPVMIAHSFGGYPALYLAANHPARVKAAILVDVVLQPPIANPGASLLDARPHPTYPTLAAALARFRLKPAQPSTCPYVTDHIARTGLRRVAGDGGSSGWTRRFDPAIWPKSDRLDRGELLSAARSPLAIVTGGKSWSAARSPALISSSACRRGRPGRTLPMQGITSWSINPWR